MRVETTTATRATLPPSIARLPVLGGAMAIGGIVLLIYAFLRGQEGFFHSYFYGWMFWNNVTLGCLLWMMIIYAARATWGRPVVRMFEAGAKLLPLMFVLFLPLLAGLPYLYPWANPDQVAHDQVLQHRAAYMNIGWFAFRAVIYYLIWGGLTAVITASSARQDATGDIREDQVRFNISPPGIVLFVLAATLATTDWVMSADPHWFSTIFGLLLIDGMALAAMSLMVMLFTSSVARDPYERLFNRDVSRDLGNMLLVFTMVWGYFSVSQWIIQWSGNLPEEISYYLKRLNGGLLAYGSFMVAFQFFVPFVLLLSSRAKRTPGLLFGIALLLFVVRVFDLWWIVMPNWRHNGLLVTAGDLGAWLFFGGLWLAGFVVMLGRAALYPRYALIKASEEVHATQHA